MFRWVRGRARRMCALPVILFGQSGDAIVQTDELLKSSRKRDMNPAQATLGYRDKSLACSKSDQFKIILKQLQCK